MSRAQRFTFLAIAIVIAAVAGILLIGNEDAGDPESTGAAATATAEPAATAAPTETATPTPTPATTPKPQPTLIGPGKVTRLRFRQGQEVRFRVRADSPDEIHVHGYDIYADVGPDAAVVSFPASITGIFEIELHGTGEQIAQLRVDPG